MKVQITIEGDELVATAQGEGDGFPRSVFVALVEAAPIGGSFYSGAGVGGCRWEWRRKMRRTAIALRTVGEVLKDTVERLRAYGLEVELR